MQKEIIQRTIQNINIKSLSKSRQEKLKNAINIILFAINENHRNIAAKQKALLDNIDKISEIIQNNKRVQMSYDLIEKIVQRQQILRKYR